VSSTLNKGYPHIEGFIKSIHSLFLSLIQYEEYSIKIQAELVNKQKDFISCFNLNSQTFENPVN